MSIRHLRQAAFVRVSLRNGDARQGRLVGWDDRFLWVNDGVERRIELVMVDQITPVARPYEECLRAC